MGVVGSLFVVLRVKQWVKNTLLFLPLVVSGSSIDFKVVLIGFSGFLLFSITASFGYALNDAKDRDKDVFHVEKINRVSAWSFFSSRNLAYVYLALFSLAVVIAIFLVRASVSLSFFAVLLIYLSMTSMYSLYLKRIPILEMFIVSSGFLYRVVAGGLLFDLLISSWLLLVTATSALYLVSLKRLAEFRSPIDNKHKRVVISNYNLPFLTATPTVFLSMTIVFYCLWAFTVPSNTVYTQFSVIPFVYALMQVFLQSNKLSTVSLEDAITKDLSVVVSGILLVSLVWIGVMLK